MDFLISPMMDPQMAQMGIEKGAERLGRTLANKSGQVGSREELRMASQMFEAYFIAELMKAMRQTVPTGLLENKAGKHFNYFYDQEIGRLGAQAGGLGLATMLVEQLAGQDSSEEAKISLKSLSQLTDSASENLQAPPGQPDDHDE